jgi:WD40 repeat protein
VSSVTFSPDGHTVAAAGPEGVCLWNAATGKLIAHFTLAKRTSFNQVEFLSRSRYLVTQTLEGRILFWELSPSQKRPLRGPQSDANSPFALSGDGKRLAFVKDGTIRLWDVNSGEEGAQLAQPGKAFRLSISSKGQVLVAADGRTVTLWDLSTGKVLRKLPASEEQEDGQPLRGGRQPQIISLSALSPDGQIIAGVMSTRPQLFLHVWETRTGKELHVVRLTERVPSSLTFLPDGKRLALADHQGVRLWDVRTGEPCGYVRVYSNNYFSLAFAPDGRTLATGHVYNVRLWDVATGREKYPIPEQRQRVGFISLFADGRTLITAGKPTDGMPPFGNIDPEAPVLLFWAAATGKRRLSPWDAKKPFPPFADLSADQRTLAAWGEKGIIQLWDVKTGQKLGQVTYEGTPDDYALSDDGKLFVIGTRDRLRPLAESRSRLELRDVRTGNSLGEFKGIHGLFGEMRFSPNGRMLAAIDGNNHTLHLWDTATRKELFWFQPKPRLCDHLAFSRDNRVLAVASFDTEILFVQVPSGKGLPHMPATESAQKLRSGNGIFSLLFSPDGKRLIVADRRGNIFVFERASGRLLKEWQAHASGFPQLALSADGRVLVTRGANTALVWDMEQLLRKKD